MEDIRIVRDSGYTYNLFDEFFIKGKVPWFMEYNDLSLIYNLSKRYADSNVGNNAIVMELLASVISRDSEDRSVYYRTVRNKKDSKPVFVPMSSVYYSFTNTTNKIVGSYMSKGLISALVNPSDKTENIERILRT